MPSEVNTCAPSFTPLCQGVASCSARSSWTETDEGRAAGCSRPWAWARAGRGALQNTASSWRATVSSRLASDTQATSWTLCWPPKHNQTRCRKVTAASLCLWLHQGWEQYWEAIQLCFIPSSWTLLATSFFLFFSSLLRLCCARGRDHPGQRDALRCLAVPQHARPDRGTGADEGTVRRPAAAIRLWGHAHSSNVKLPRCFYGL